MVAKGSSSKRYAQAVFQIALERKELDKWQSYLKAMGAVLGDPQLSSLLENPKVPFGQKQDILRQVLAGVGPLAMNLAFLLVAKNRLSMLGDIGVEYGHLVDAHQGRAHAEITTAVPLEEADRRTLEAKLAEAIKKQIVLTARVDAGIVGGLVVRIGDQLIDGSVHTRLQQLKRSLSQAGLG